MASTARVSPRSFAEVPFLSQAIDERGHGAAELIQFVFRKRLVNIEETRDREELLAHCDL
jgi:hypothetical protein